MTKEQFKMYDKDTVFCSCCNKILPKHYFSYSYIRLDGTASRCKVCDWIKRKVYLPKIENIPDSFIRKIIGMILCENFDCVNTLSTALNIDIECTIKIIKSLKITNGQMWVKTKCCSCGKAIKKSIRDYITTNNTYCSMECYWNDKPNTIGHGKDNVSYKRIKVGCTNCKKEIEIIPYNYKLKNRYGDNHNFCCQKCYWEFRSKYYVGDKSTMHNAIFTDEQREKMKIRIINNSRNANRFNSKIQLLVNSILDQNNIAYKREYIIKYYAVDNYLTESNLIIEVMGDYWHTSPLKYNENKHLVNEMQQKGLQRDKQKYSYIKNHLGTEILYLWESDIEQNIELCKQLILEYIRSNGILNNYHSFNWTIRNGTLFENQNIIIPYQDMKVTEYKHLIKTKVG